MKISLKSFQKWSENQWKWSSGGDWRASWSQDGAQERQEELQEGPLWPTWRQDEPTWLENGDPNP